MRDEIRETEGNVDDVQMSLYRVAYPAGGQRVAYADPVQYGTITEPTDSLVTLMAEVGVRLGSGEHYRRGPALIHLDQGMGGGKSHALIGLYHLATAPDALARTDVGREVMGAAAAHTGGRSLDLARVRVVSLCCDHMTPMAPLREPEFDGPAETLWQRFLWRLVERDYDTYNRLRGQQDKAGIIEAFRAVGHPVLILVDEIMDYVRLLDDEAHAVSRNQDLAFIRALMDAVNDVPHVCAVFVLISSDRDPTRYDPVAVGFREEFQALVTRNGATRAVSRSGDFTAIVRRRLFEAPPPEDATRETASAFAAARTGAWQKQVFGKLPPPPNWERDVAACYPFHPDLLDLVSRVWGTLAAFQHVRSTFSLFTRAAFVWNRRGETGEWAPTLIGLGDLPLDDGSMQEHLLHSGVISSDALATNYRQVMATDIADPARRSGRAQAIDRAHAAEPWHGANPRAAQRMATALLLSSLVAHGSGVLGATEAEVRAASFVPDPGFAAPDSEIVFNELTDQETGLGSLDFTAGRPRRYLLTTRQTLPMLYRARLLETADDPACKALAWKTAVDFIEGKGPTGGFQAVRKVENSPDPVTGGQRPAKDVFSSLGEGEERRTRLLVLDPDRWLLLNGRDDETRCDIQSVFGIPPEDGLKTNGASTLAVACANRHNWTSGAVQRARHALAWQRVLAMPAVQADDGLRAEAHGKLKLEMGVLGAAVKAAFQHYAFLIRDASDALVVSFEKLEQAGRSALSADQVWTALVDKGRAADSLTAATFDALLGGRLPKTLKDIADEFIADPHFPMLKNEGPLKAAIFDAVRSGRMELLGLDKEPLPVPDGPADIAVRSPDQTLQWKASDTTGNSDRENGDGRSGGPGGTGGGGGDNGGSGRGGGSESGGGEGGGGKQTEPQGTLSMHVRAAVGDGIREALVSLFNRLAQDIDEGAATSVDATIRVDANRKRLDVLSETGKRIPGTKPHIDDLP